MGRPKTPRIRIELEAQRVAAKSLYQCVLSQLRKGFAVPPRLAQQLTTDALSYLSRLPNQRLPEQIRVSLPKGRDNHSRKFAMKHTQSVLLTPCTFEPDLVLLRTQGIKALQNARLIRLVREAWLQDTLMVQDLLAHLCNMTRKTLYARLAHLRSLGIRLSTLGDRCDERPQTSLDYSTRVLRELIEGRPTSDVQRRYYVTPAMLDALLHRLRVVRHYAQRGHQAREIAGLARENVELIVEYLDLIDTHRAQSHFELLVPEELPTCPVDPDLPDTTRFFEMLQSDYGLPRAEAATLHNDLIATFGPQAAAEREDGQLLFHAIKTTEPAGKPLSECELVPLVLDFFTEADRSIEKVDVLKLQKAQRYAEQAKAQGAYLTHGDLSYLLGVSTFVIGRLQASQIKKGDTPFPTRGREADIGRAVSHRTQIIDLWMQLYTETEIVKRTGHDYSSVENYILAFARFLLLKDREMPLPMIRKVLDCSMKLVEAYEDLYEKYNDEEKHWYRLGTLRSRVLRDPPPESEAAKKKRTRTTERRARHRAEGWPLPASALQEPGDQTERSPDSPLRVREEVALV